MLIFEMSAFEILAGIKNSLDFPLVLYNTPSKIPDVEI